MKGEHIEESGEDWDPRPQRNPSYPGETTGNKGGSQQDLTGAASCSHWQFVPPLAV